MTDTVKLNIWNREFFLSVIYDCYKGEKITNKQIDAFEFFLKHSEWIDSSKSKVEAYCSSSVLEDEENEKKDNIFSYVKPDCIFVKRDEKHPRVAIMCKYRYDPEHGLAIVFSKDGEVTVGSQDLIL